MAIVNNHKVNSVFFAYDTQKKLIINQPFSKWPDIFSDSVIANAIIDRFVHHCDIVKITDQSYRIKGRRIFDDQDE